MEYGFYLPNNGPTATPEHLITCARRGESLGFNCMVVGDHVIVPKNIASSYPYPVGGEFPGAASGEYLEQLTLLTFLAGATERIRLVPSVMILPHRNPVLAAKVLATMDVLSRGRLTVGVGVGWMEEEFETLGLPPLPNVVPLATSISGSSKSSGPAMTPASRGSIAGFPTSVSCPSRCKNPILLSGWEGRPAWPSDGPQS